MVSLALGLLFAVIVAGLSRQAWAAIPGFVIGVVWAYLGTPTLAWGFLGLPFMIFFAGLIGMLLSGLTEDEKIFAQAMGATIAFAAVVLPAAFFTSAPIFHAGAYRARIGTVEEGAFHDDMKIIDQSQIRIVDEGLAVRRAEELIGTDPGLGSRVHFGTFTIQNVAGKLYWVAPLEHSNFLRWLNNESTPGYVMVSASDLRDARIVLQRDGKPMALRYMPSSYFGYDLERHLWQSGYATIGFTDFNFELDDSGKPYWVVTLYKKNVGFGGSKATGVAIVDPETGAIRKYAIDDAPAWVERIQPSSLAVEGSATLTKIEGRVSRLGVETMKDGTFYYLLLEEAPDRIYVGTARLSPKLPLTREGDRIAIRADDTMTSVVDMASFDNLDLELRRNPREEALESAAETARETERAVRQERAAEAAWGKLSPAEKKKLLESLGKTGG